MVELCTGVCLEREREPKYRANQREFRYFFVRKSIQWLHLISSRQQSSVIRNTFAESEAQFVILLTYSPAWIYIPHTQHRFSLFGVITKLENGNNSNKHLNIYPAAVPRNILKSFTFCCAFIYLFSVCLRFYSTFNFWFLHGFTLFLMGRRAAEWKILWYSCYLKKTGEKTARTTIILLIELAQRVSESTFYMW